MRNIMEIGMKLRQGRRRQGFGCRRHCKHRIGVLLRTRARIRRGTSRVIIIIVMRHSKPSPLPLYSAILPSEDIGSRCCNGNAMFGFTKERDSRFIDAVDEKEKNQQRPRVSWVSSGIPV